MVCKYVCTFLLSKIFPFMHTNVCVLRYIKTSLKCFVLLAFHSAEGSEHACQSSYSVILEQKTNNILPQIFKHIHTFCN